MNKYIKHLFLACIALSTFNKANCMADLTLTLQDDSNNKFTQLFSATSEIDSSILWGTKAKSFTFMNLICRFSALISFNRELCKQTENGILQHFVASFLSAIVEKVEFIKNSIEQNGAPCEEIDLSENYKKIVSGALKLQTCLTHEINTFLSLSCEKINMRQLQAIIIGNLVKLRSLSLFMLSKDVNSRTLDKTTIMSYCQEYSQLPCAHQKLRISSSSSSSSSSGQQVEITSKTHSEFVAGSDAVVVNVETKITSPKKAARRLSLEHKQTVEFSCAKSLFGKSTEEDNGEIIKRRRCDDSSTSSDMNPQRNLMILRAAQRMDALAKQLNQTFDKSSYSRALKASKYSYQHLQSLVNFLERELVKLTEETAETFNFIYLYLIDRFFTLDEFEAEILFENLEGNYALLYETVRELA